MWNRNDGTSESNVLQNQFTAYLITAIKRRKIQYIESKTKLQQNEVPLEIQDFLNQFKMEPDMTSELPFLDQLENAKLRQALEQSKERELYIFLSKVLDERSLVEIAKELDMEYNTVAAVYYRVIKKIKNKLGGDD